MDRVHLENLYEYAKYRHLPHDFKLSAPFKEGDNSIPPAIYLGQFQYLHEQSKDAHFGLHFGAFLSLQAMHIIFDISLTVSSIKQLVLLWKAYASASFPLLSMTTVEEEKKYHLVFNSVLHSQLEAQILDAVTIFAYKELKIIVGTDLMSVSIPSKKLEEYNLWFDCPVVEGKAHSIRFNCSSDQIVTNEKRRKRIETMLPAFLYYLENLKSCPASFSHQVHLMVLHLCASTYPTIDQVAAQFCVSTRTLQRRLLKENTSYRAIVHELKKNSILI